MRSLQLFIATLAAASALRVGGAPRLQPRSSRVVLQQPPEATDGASPAGRLGTLGTLGRWFPVTRCAFITPV